MGEVDLLLAAFAQEASDLVAAVDEGGGLGQRRQRQCNRFGCRGSHQIPRRTLRRCNRILIDRGRWCWLRRHLSSRGVPIFADRNALRGSSSTRCPRSRRTGGPASRVPLLRLRSRHASQGQGDREADRTATRKPNSHFLLPLCRPPRSAPAGDLAGGAPEPAADPFFFDSEEVGLTPGVPQHRGDISLRPTAYCGRSKSKRVDRRCRSRSERRPSSRHSRQRHPACRGAPESLTALKESEHKR